jgi:hypothetical protein
MKQQNAQIMVRQQEVMQDAAKAKEEAEKDQRNRIQENNFRKGFRDRDYRPKRRDEFHRRDVNDISSDFQRLSLTNQRGRRQEYRVEFQTSESSRGRRNNFTRHDPRLFDWQSDRKARH